MAVYAIGDLQGCLDPLRRLLERIRFDPSADRLWFTGDLVNRGPKSLDTLRFVRSLGDAAVSVLGNHDLHLLAVAAGFAPAKTNDTLAPILEALDRDELLRWLRQRPILHESPEAPRYTLVHAGIPPNWDLATARSLANEVECALRGDDYLHFLEHLYGDRPDRWHPELTGEDRLRFAVNAFTRMRYCAPDGRLLLDFKGPPEEAPPEHFPWFRSPSRQSLDRIVIFGHWSTLGFHHQHDALGLDTGCLWGGSLTAVRLDRELPAISEPCAVSMAPGPGR